MNEDDVLVSKSDRLESIVPLSDVETGYPPCLSIMSERKCSLAKTYFYLDIHTCCKNILSSRFDSIYL